MIWAALLAAGVLLLPMVVLSPVLNRFVNNMLGVPQMRAIVRKAFGIDRTATLADVPDSTGTPAGGQRA